MCGGGEEKGEICPDPVLVNFHFSEKRWDRILLTAVCFEVTNSYTMTFTLQLHKLLHAFVVILVVGERRGCCSTGIRNQDQDERVTEQLVYALCE
jgi:hypothetical protein